MRGLRRVNRKKMGAGLAWAWAGLPPGVDFQRLTGRSRLPSR